MSTEKNTQNNLTNKSEPRTDGVTHKKQPPPDAQNQSSNNSEKK